MTTLQKYSKHMFMLLYMLVSEDFCIKKLILPYKYFIMTMWKVQKYSKHTFMLLDMLVLQD